MQRETKNFLFCLKPGALVASAEPTMVQEKQDGLDKDMVLPSIQQRPAVRALPAWLTLIVVSILLPVDGSKIICHSQQNICKLI